MWSRELKNYEKDLQIYRSTVHQMTHYFTRDEVSWMTSDYLDDFTSDKEM